MMRHWLQRPRRRIALGLAMGSGALYALGFCGYEQWYLAWICLVPVLWALDDDSLSRWEALTLAWTAGLTAHLACYPWLVHMLQVFAGLPLPLALLGYSLLCAAQSLQVGAWGLAMHWLVQRRGVSMVWAAPVAWVLSEWLFPALFPSYLANSQYRQILTIQSLNLWGPLGLSGLLAGSSAIIYQILAWGLRRRCRFPTAALLTGLALGLGNVLYGYACVVDIDDTLDHADRPVTVGMVQTSMGIYEKWENPEEGLRRHREQSLEVEAQGAQLIIWPESGFFYPIDSAVKNVKSAVLGPLHTPLLFGGLRSDQGPLGRELYNTAFLADGDGTVLGTYDKTYLLMFGEYLPLGEWLPFLYHLSPHTSHFMRGQSVAPLKLQGISYGLLICYEDILPGFVRRVMAQRPDVLVNLTNDAWFGRTREPRIHLALGVLRAVEQRRFLVRATNTGISAIVDPAGRITAQTPVFSRANLVGDVMPLQDVTLYQRLGESVGFLAAGLAMWWSRGALTRYWRPRERPTPQTSGAKTSAAPRRTGQKKQKT